MRQRAYNSNTKISVKYYLNIYFQLDILLKTEKTNHYYLCASVFCCLSFVFIIFDVHLCAQPNYEMTFELTLIKIIGGNVPKFLFGLKYYLIQTTEY